MNSPNHTPGPPPEEPNGGDSHHGRSERCASKHEIALFVQSLASGDKFESTLEKHLHGCAACRVNAARYALDFGSLDAHSIGEASSAPDFEVVLSNLDLTTPVSRHWLIVPKNSLYLPRLFQRFEVSNVVVRTLAYRSSNDGQQAILGFELDGTYLSLGHFSENWPEFTVTLATKERPISSLTPHGFLLGGRNSLEVIREFSEKAVIFHSLTIGNLAVNTISDSSTDVKIFEEMESFDLQLSAVILAPDQARWESFVKELSIWCSEKNLWAREVAPAEIVVPSVDEISFGEITSERSRRFNGCE